MNSKRMYLITVIIFIHSVVACKSSQVPLSEKEMDFANSLAQKCKCDVFIQHDRRAVKEKKQNGVFIVNLSNDPQNNCASDSLTLTKTAKEISSKLKNIVSHKENYSTISISFTTTKNTGSNSTQTICDKEVLIDFNSTYIKAFTIHF